MYGDEQIGDRAGGTKQLAEQAGEIRDKERFQPSNAEAISAIRNGLTRALKMGRSVTELKEIVYLETGFGVTAEEIMDVLLTGSGKSGKRPD
jgi:hypothetical protein